MGVTSTTNMQPRRHMDNNILRLIRPRIRVMGMVVATNSLLHLMDNIHLLIRAMLRGSTRRTTMGTVDQAQRMITSKMNPMSMAQPNTYIYICAFKKICSHCSIVKPGHPNISSRSNTAHSRRIMAVDHHHLARQMHRAKTAA
jgi:hypothetical protein